jgi:hypothetical protein
MKNWLWILVFFAFFSTILLAQEKSTDSSDLYIDIGTEIQNTVIAVKTARPGDYIVLKSGKKYILTKEEIEIVRGEFDFSDLSEVYTEIRDDGTAVKSISGAHKVYQYPDGQFSHLLKTGASFSALMGYIESKYHIALFNDYYDKLHESVPVSPQSFNVFRGIIQFQVLSDGQKKMESITITVYNHNDNNYKMRYCSMPEMIWGYISDEGAFNPVGEAYEMEFDIE